MDIIDEILKMGENRKREKISTFLKFVREGFESDVEQTARLYTRDKGKNGLRVVKLSSGMFAVVNVKDEILYKHNDVHQCKVEFLMMTSVDDMSMFTSKL